MLSGELPPTPEQEPRFEDQSSEQLVVAAVMLELDELKQINHILRILQHRSIEDITDQHRYDLYRAVFNHRNLLFEHQDRTQMRTEFTAIMTNEANKDQALLSELETQENQNIALARLALGGHHE